MPGKPLDPQPSRQPTPGSGRSESLSGRPGERTGALFVARHVKDDGRALILYSRDDADSAAAAERE